MKKQDSIYAWLGWGIAIILGIVILAPIFNSSSNNQNTTEVESTQAQSTAPDVTPETPQPAENAWSCVDATSYNQNAFDDNRCTNGSETRYVSDSQAVSLDPSYSPGKSGASYYNNR